MSALTVGGGELTEKIQMVFMQSFKHNHLQVSEDEQNDRLSSQSISGKLRKKDKKEPFPPFLF